MATNTAANGSTILAFMKVYDQEYYGRLAKAAEAVCCHALQDKKVPHLTESRGKKPKSLRTKLENKERHRDGHYNGFESIEAEITDMAGARILIYDPTDREKVGTIIENAFDVHHKVGHQKTSGYRADHYIVFLKKEDLRRHGLGDATKRRLVEIQVMTISHSLWSRIEHDRVYKPNKWERPEPEELERLSIIQQVVGLQENILKHDRQASDRKTAKDNQLFSNLGQVENYFSKWITKYAEEWIKDKPIGPFEPVDMYLATHRTRTRASLNELLQENFGTASEEEYLTIASEYAPVKLNLVIYLMDRLFLTTISEGGYEPDARIDSDEKDNVLRTKVIMSTMLWLNKLFTSTLAWQRKLIAPVDERPVRELDWLRSTGQYFLLKKPEWKKRDIKSVNDLWNWFENHNERPIKLAFYMSKRGLIRSGREEKEVMFNTIGTLTDALKIRT